ncbi:MAG: hypothetical protein ACREAN_03565 [Nitrosopumilaceae archaeon]
MQAPAQSTKSSKTGIIVIGVIVVVALILVALVAPSLMGSNLSPKSNPGSNIQPPTTLNVVNGLITVSAGSYESYQIIVPAGASNVQITGTFTASGGSGNNIQVIIMDSTNYVNWQNGNQASAYYDSGQETTGNIATSLPGGAGTYYLVYSNTFSTFSSKNVNTQADLVYTPS